MNHMEYDSLKNFRNQIDNIDKEIMILIKRRMQFAKKIAKYKFDNNMEIFVPAREDEIINIAKNRAITMNLSESFTRNLFQMIIDESKREQEKFLSKKNLKKNNSLEI